METGETVKVDAVLAEPVQANVPPIGVPVAVKVVLSPEQIVELLTVTVGVGFTVTIPVPVALHPFKEYITVYDVVVIGFTSIELVCCVLFHK